MNDLKRLQQITKNLNVLYVEDDHALREKTAQVFSQLFKRVDTAEDGQKGLEQYEEYVLDHNTYYDIVISDIQMPRLNGIRLSRRLLEIRSNQKIIITSAHNDKEYLIELINIGVSGFLEKPLQIQQMVEIIANVVSSLNTANNIDLGNGYRFDGTLKILFLNSERIDLSDHEIKLLDLLTSNTNQSFSAIDIFNHIHYDDPSKDYSEDSIKSLIKRLRKKLPDGLILNTPKLGYYLKKHPMQI